MAKKTLEELAAAKAGKSKNGKKDVYPKERADGTMEMKDGTILRKVGNIYHNITDPDTLIMQGEADRLREKEVKDKPATTEKKKLKFYGADPNDPLFG